MNGRGYTDAAGRGHEVTVGLIRENLPVTSCWATGCVAGPSIYPPGRKSECEYGCERCPSRRKMFGRRRRRRRRHWARTEAMSNSNNGRSNLSVRGDRPTVQIQRRLALLAPLDPLASSRVRDERTSFCRGRGKKCVRLRVCHGIAG